ncbi:MAG: lytic transglycosylase domain-containing protein [Treponema sp.]|nr:lytic transglycosylase domain-containing protein [Treponema sp.]
MNSKNGNTGFSNSCIFFSILGILFCAAAFGIYFLVPAEEKGELVSVVSETNVEIQEEIPTFVNYLNEVAENSFKKESDAGLELYRNPESRSAVEWFYSHVTGKQDVAYAILQEAEKNGIPLSLAFSLAYTESRYNTNAVNRNSNDTVDRGLFQLNSNSFPNLTESDFFDPAISAKYGMSHLKFCLNTAGNEVSALAMYNAGTGKVRANKTPQSTLNYVGKIMAYQDTIDRLFDDEVASYFETKLSSKASVAMASKN